MAKANKLDIEYIDATPLKGHADYLKLNPLNRVPSFEGKDGYVLSECMAIAIYRKFVRIPEDNTLASI